MQLPAKTSCISWNLPLRMTVNDPNSDFNGPITSVSTLCSQLVVSVAHSENPRSSYRACSWSAAHKSINLSWDWGTARSHGWWEAAQRGLVATTRRAHGWLSRLGCGVSPEVVNGLISSFRAREREEGGDTNEKWGIVLNRRLKREAWKLL